MNLQVMHSKPALAIISVKKTISKAKYETKKMHETVIKMPLLKVVQCL